MRRLNGRAWRPRRAVTGLVARDDQAEANGSALGFSPNKLLPFAPPGGGQLGGPRPNRPLRELNLFGSSAQTRWFAEFWPW